ncbi:MAG: hypothetical protein Q9173_000619 [Seirophora scorigena]
MSRVSYFGGKPTQIRPTVAEYLSPSERSYTLTDGTAFDTKWTRRMLQRLQSLSRSSLEDTTILAALKEEFDAPKTVEEIIQERAFLATGPKQDATWTEAMEETVVELYEQGFNAQDLTEVMMRRFKRPSNWTETYRKIQQLVLAGVVE